MPVISIITQHIGLAEEIKGNKTAKDDLLQVSNENYILMFDD